MDEKTKQQRSIGRTLEPTVRIGKSGITDGVIKDLTTQLRQRKVVKVRIMASKREEKAEIAAALATKCKAKLVDKIGNIAVYAKEE